MKYFSSAEGLVPVGFEVAHDRPGVLQHRILVPAIEAKVPRVMWVYSGEKAGSRGAAYRDGAVCLHKAYAATHKARHVWGLRLRVPTVAFDVVVEVVGDDEEHVRFFF